MKGTQDSLGAGCKDSCEVFLLFFFALQLVYIREAWKSPVSCHVSTRVVRGHRQITDPLVHAQRSLLCPYKRCFPRKCRIGKAPWFFSKKKPKSNHLEKKSKIHSKVLKTRLWSCLWTGFISLCDPTTSNPISQRSGLSPQRPHTLLMCIWLFTGRNLPREKAGPASTLQIPLAPLLQFPPGCTYDATSIVKALINKPAQLQGCAVVYPSELLLSRSPSGLVKV